MLSGSGERLGVSVGDGKGAMLLEGTGELKEHGSARPLLLTAPSEPQLLPPHPWAQPPRAGTIMPDAQQLSRVGAQGTQGSRGMLIMGNSSSMGRNTGSCTLCTASPESGELTARTLQLRPRPQASLDRAGQGRGIPTQKAWGKGKQVQQHDEVGQPPRDPAASAGLPRSCPCQQHALI